MDEWQKKILTVVAAAICTVWVVFLFRDINNPPEKDGTVTQIRQIKGMLDENEFEEKWIYIHHGWETVYIFRFRPEESPPVRPAAPVRFSVKKPKVYVLVGGEKYVPYLIEKVRP